MLLVRKQKLLQTLVIVMAIAPSTVLSAEGDRNQSTAKDADQLPTEPEHIGFLLGDFYLRDFRPIEGVKTKLTFTVHAAVKAEASNTFDRRLERRQMRVRDQVITALRLAEPEEFQDPELRLIRRRLFLRLKRALPDLPIEEVYFSEFRYFIE